MAKATLPTNYKDDIMATPMNGLRRYRPIQNDDGTVSFEDVTDYTQVGSNFGAAQMNQTNTAVNNSADKSRIIDSLADVAANTQAGMMAGALAVRELNGKIDDKVSFKLDSCTKNILSYAHTLPDTSFSIMKYKGYNTNGELINAAPTNSDGIAIISRNTIDYITVIAIPYDNTGVYSRSKNAGKWEAWKK